MPTLEGDPLVRHMRRVTPKSYFQRSPNQFYAPLTNLLLYM